MTAKAFRSPSLPDALLARVALACAGLIGVACASQQRPVTPTAEGQSYAEALRLICEVDRHLEGADSASEIELGEMRQDYIVENTHNPDGIYFVTVWRTKPPVEQSALLTQEAAEHKVGDCALAKSLADAAQAR